MPSELFGVVQVRVLLVAPSLEVALVVLDVLVVLEVVMVLVVLRGSLRWKLRVHGRNPYTRCRMCRQHRS